MKIYWSSTSNICCYSIFPFCCYIICLFCCYIIHNKYDFITLSHWGITNTFQILTIFTNTCPRIPTIIIYACIIIFTLTFTPFIIPFLIQIKCCSIEFAFAITWNILFHCFSFIFVCYRTKCFNISVFCFIWNTYFWRQYITSSCILI